MKRFTINFINAIKGNSVVETYSADSLNKIENHRHDFLTGNSDFFNLYYEVIDNLTHKAVSPEAYYFGTV